MSAALVYSDFGHTNTLTHIQRRRLRRRRRNERHTESSLGERTLRLFASLLAGSNKQTSQSRSRSCSGGSNRGGFVRWARARAHRRKPPASGVPFESRAKARAFCGLGFTILSPAAAAAVGRPPVNWHKAAALIEPSACRHPFAAGIRECRNTSISMGASSSPSSPSWSFRSERIDQFRQNSGSGAARAD